MKKVLSPHIKLTSKWLKIWQNWVFHQSNDPKHKSKLVYLTLRFCNGFKAPTSAALKSCGLLSKSVPQNYPRVVKYLFEILPEAC